MSQERYLPPTTRRVLPAAAPARAYRRSFDQDETEPTVAPLDLRQILAILRRRIWMILLVGAVGLGAAVYLTMSAAPVYQANGVIRLADTRRELTGGLVDQSDNAGPRLSADPVLSEIAVLTSRAVVGKVIDSLPALRLRTTGIPVRLIREVRFEKQLPDSIGYPAMNLSFDANGITVTATDGERVRAAYGSPIEIGGMSFKITSQPKVTVGGITVIHRDDAVSALAASIKAKPREGTNVIDVAYNSTDPVRAQQVINTLLPVFHNASIEAAAQEAHLRREFIEGQLRQNDSLLNNARVALSDFRSREQAYSAKEKFTAQRTDLTGVEAQQQELAAERRQYAAALDRLQQGNGREGLQTIGALLATQGAAGNQILTGLYTQIQQLQTARDSLTTGPWARAATNPDVQKLDVLIAGARTRLVRTLQDVVIALDQRRAALDTLKAQNAATLVQIPASDAEEARLTEREEAYQKIADQLREELQKARLSEAAEVGQIEIVDLAVRPHRPIGTSDMQKMLFGLLLGLFFGGGLALVTEHLNTAIRGRDELESALRLPGLAVIPKLPDRKHGRKRLWRSRNGTTGNGKVGKNGGAGKLTPALVASKQLVTVSDMHSAGAEAYRTLRTKLLFSRALSSLKTIVVTSPFAQDGKSTVAANLATTFAQHGMRVLLIDCDLRKPTQHEIFQVPSEPGLTELLAGEGFVAGTGRRTAIDGLSLITSGALPPDPAEVMGSVRMREMLAKLADSFDVVVLDTPPVLPVADSAILSSLADGVLLVVRAGQTNRRAAQLAIQQLQDVDARIIGAVLNDPNAQVPRYDDYGYASYYGYHAKK